MTPNDNIDTVKKLYDAFGQGDVDTILDNVTDDVDWAAEAAGDTAPWWGQRNGKDEVGRFFQEFADAADVLDFTPTAFTANDDEVMSLVRFRVKYKSTGNEAAMNLHHYWRFEDGKVAQYRGSEDTQQSAAGLEG